MAFLSLCAAPSRAITAEQAKTAIEAFNNVYWHATNKTFYKFDNKTGELDYWMWAHAWETEMDAYERTKDPIYLQKIRDTYDVFTAKNGTKMNNAYNDDQGWWVMAATRAYDLTGVADYQTFAKTNFDWMLANQTDTIMGGGIWWKNSDKNQKNSASTLPFAVAGFKLARQLADPNYSEKARKLHEWVKAKLFRPSGEVADRIQRNGTAQTTIWGPLSYNHGTFISSSWEMFKLTKDSAYFRDAIATMNYFKTVKCDAKTGIFPDERGDGTGNTDNDAGMYKTVFVHYAMRFIIEAQQWQYLPWLNVNANSLWANRRTSDNLMYFAWSTPAPTGAGKIGAQMATGGVSLLNLLVVAEAIQAQYSEGVDTTNAQGQGLSNVFTVSANGVSGNGHKIAIYHLPYITEGNVNSLYPGSFADIKKVPADFQALAANNLPGTSYLNSVFVIKLGDSTYAKVTLLKKLPDGRYLYRYGVSKVPNNTVFMVSDYARNALYKPENLEIQSFAPHQGAANNSTSIFKWEAPLPGDNVVTGYALYIIDVSKADTTKPVNLADWTLLASTDQTTYTWNRVGDDKDKYVNLVAVYANGKSAPLDGWGVMANPNRTPDRVGQAGTHPFAFEFKNGTFVYSLPVEGRLTLTLYDFSGRKLETLYSGVRKVGRYSLTLPKGRPGSDNYLLRIAFNEETMFMRFAPIDFISARK